MTPRGSAALRRYPALAYLVTAGVLALLLPSGLNVLQSGPTTLAEYAPVPGHGSGEAPLEGLDAASSPGAGAGVGPGRTDAVAAGERADPTVGGGRLVRRPGTKRCVGEPPRQTEDPLSPPCVAFFDGDNGGATAPGVSPGEVTVLVRLSNGAGRQEEDVVDCAPEVTDADVFVVQECKALMRYFNERYQTYGRTVHLYSVNDSAPMIDLFERYRPFAVAGVASSNAAAHAKVLQVSYTGTNRQRAVETAPYTMSFRADSEDQIAQTATYVCQRLVGGSARYAGNPELRTRERKFGFLYWSSESRRKTALAKAIEASCGVSITVESTDFDRPTGPAKLLQENVTTVILLVGNTGHVTATNNATALGYFPEWFVPGNPDLNGVDVNFHGRTANAAQWQNAFGVTFDLRRSAVNEQPWYRAYREGCPDCIEPTTGTPGALFAAASYDALSLLFYGIQAAGPRLTVENVDKGLHAIPPRASTDPFTPAAYFAPGNYSFVKDAMPIWWDPTGQPPGSASQGCYRLPEEGRRYRAGEWPAGDDLVKGAGPCQADTFQ